MSAKQQRVPSWLPVTSVMFTENLKCFRSKPKFTRGHHASWGGGVIWNQVACFIMAVLKTKKKVDLDLPYLTDCNKPSWANDEQPKFDNTISG